MSEQKIGREYEEPAGYRLRIISEGLSIRDYEMDVVFLDAKQALKLLAFLFENQDELEQLAKEQES